MELADIKNNKGTMTLQIKSIEHLQTWIKKNQKLQSELLIKPLEITAEIITSSLLEPDFITSNWWLDKNQ